MIRKIKRLYMQPIPKPKTIEEFLALKAGSDPVLTMALLKDICMRVKRMEGKS